MARALFRLLFGDVNPADYGATYYRRVGKRRYHVMALMNWEDATGERCDGNLYNVGLYEVDLIAIPPDNIKDALRCIGAENDESPSDLMLLDACVAYGCKAPLGEFNGNNYRALLAEARAQSADLDDPVAHREAMEKPVNRMGSSAHQYMVGDLSGPPRGVSARVQMSEVPSDDPIAYSMGFMHGTAGSPLPAERDDLAPEYLKGYHAGVENTNPRQPAPGWIK